MPNYKTVVTYSFDELSEDAKENAVNRLYDINTDHDWYIFTIDYYKEQFEIIGLSFDKCYFDIDRNNNIELTKISVDAPEKFLNAYLMNSELYTFSMPGERLESEITNDTSSIHFEYQNHGNNNLETYLETIENELTDYLNDLKESILSSLKLEYKYLNSSPVIIETIKCNEYEFTKEGALY